MQAIRTKVAGVDVHKEILAITVLTGEADKEPEVLQFTCDTFTEDLMAMALWQNARDYLPYLLDPTTTPKSEVSLSDGLIAALIFFVLQGISSAFMSFEDKELTGKEMAIAFAIAGFVIYLALQFIYWRKGTSGVPKVFGEPLSRILSWGIGFGLIAALIGFGYLFTVLENNWFTESLKLVKVPNNQETWWLFGVTVIAAPPF